MLDLLLATHAWLRFVMQVCVYSNLQTKNNLNRIETINKQKNNFLILFISVHTCKSVFHSIFIEKLLLEMYICKQFVLLNHEYFDFQYI